MYDTIFPDGKNFAFTIFDDTDHSTVANIGRIYDLFYECGLRTTKSVWTYPSRGDYKQSSSLADNDYLSFILDLKEKGFEIASHGVGDGYFNRNEIIEGFELFKEKIGTYPTSHANHATNIDNLYWWHKRFEWPFSFIYFLISKNPQKKSGGGEVLGNFFWGDVAKKNIKYIRNLTFNNINTIKQDPRMPYKVNKKEKYSNLWFSASDGSNVQKFTSMISKENVDKLISENGVCIVYTHLASGFISNGIVNSEFEKRIRYIAEKNGYFVPVSTLLDYLALKGTKDPGYFYRLNRNIKWGTDRFKNLLKK